MLTKLKIEIVAETDERALKILNGLRDMMDVPSGEKCELKFNPAGYSIGRQDGNGEVNVEYIKGGEEE
jgi:hypothetical protein